jgi:hypothetical protein
VRKAVELSLLEDLLRFGPLSVELADRLSFKLDAVGSVHDAIADAARLEAACRRAVYYRHDKNEAIISWILEKGLDRLPLNPYTDIWDQLTFSLERLNSGVQDNVESRIPRENISE